MYEKARSNLILGACCIAFALLLLFVWIPLDSETWIVEKVRRRLVIGDGMAPSLAALFLLIAGTMLVFLERNVADQHGITLTNLSHLGKMLGVLALATTLMRYTGPLAVEVSNMLRDEPASYRLLRDTVPWKYVGFLVGGTTLVAGLIALVEVRLTWRTLAIAIAAVLVMIVIYDLPFDDLQLPPNGDV